MRIKMQWLVLTMFVFLGAVEVDLVGQDTRSEFLAKIVKVEKGMSLAEVKGLLGEPDTIWTREDSDRIHDPHVKKVWCYGCQTRLGFPTLGRVELDEFAKVYQVIGNTGEPIAADTLDESKLCELMQMLDSAPTFAGGQFNPFELVTIANAFQPLGQKTSFAVFREYVRVSGIRVDGGEEGVYLLLCCLHEVPEAAQQLPDMFVGAAVPVMLADRKPCARFPIRFVDQLPLLLVRGFDLGGEAEPVVVYMKHFEDKIDWVAVPLVVSEKSEEVLCQALDQFRTSNHWHFSEADSSSVFEMLGAQLKRFVASRDLNP